MPSKHSSSDSDKKNKKSKTNEVAVSGDTPAILLKSMSSPVYQAVPELHGDSSRTNITNKED